MGALEHRDDYARPLQNRQKIQYTELSNSHNLSEIDVDRIPYVTALRI